MLSGGNQPQNPMSHMIPLIWNAQNRQIHRDRKPVSCCQGLGKEMGGIAHGDGVSFWGWREWSRIELRGDGCMTLWIYLKWLNCTLWRASQVALVVKNPPANAGDIRDAGSIPGSGRSPGGGHDNPLQYSGLENPWWTSVCGEAKSQTRLKRQHRHTRFKRTH